MTFKTVALLSSLLISSTALAMNQTPPQQAANHLAASYYVSATMAGSFSHLKADHIVNVPAPNPDNLDPIRYNTNGGDDFYADFGVQGGRLLQLNHRWQLAFGLGLYASLPQKLAGKYYTDINSDPDLSYTYKMKTMRVMIESKMFYKMTRYLSAFYGFGIGMGHLSDSTLSYSTGTTVANPTKSHSANHAVFSATVGLDYAVSCHWHATLSADQLWLGNNAITVYNAYGKYATLSQGDVKPWQIKLGLSYNF